MLRRLWNDECGALIASEYVVFGTILVIAGAATVRDALATELADFAAAISAIDTGFSSEGTKHAVKSTEAGSEGPIQTPLSP